MAKEKMTMDEAYTCPRCGCQAVNVGLMEQIFDDARSEDVTCMRCQSSWRVFYKMLDFNKKTLNITHTPLEDTNKVEAMEDTINTDCSAVADDTTQLSIAEET